MMNRQIERQSGILQLVTEGRFCFTINSKKDFIAIRRSAASKVPEDGTNVVSVDSSGQRAKTKTSITQPAVRLTCDVRNDASK